MTAQQASSSGGLPFPEKGSLKKVPFSRILRDAARNELTGRLYLLSGDTKKVVFFEDGQPSFVRSNVLAECLGQILADEGLITQEQCEQTLEAIRRTGKKQGELLVEMGILSEENLRYALAAQLKHKLWGIFEWNRGRYRFQPGPSNQDVRIELGRPPEGLIVEAIQNVVSEERARQAMEPYLDTYPVLRDPELFDAHALGLLPEEEYFARCLDGSRTVRAVLEERVLPVPPTPVALLHGLLQAGLVQLGKSARRAAKRPPPPDLRPPMVDDIELAPDHDAQYTITEYEDTPLPGQLPEAPRRNQPQGPDGGFDADALENSGPIPTELAAELEAAESDSVDEDFDADIELSDEDLTALEFDDEDVDVEEPGRPGLRVTSKPGGAADPDDLMSMDELDDVELDAFGAGDDLDDDELDDGSGDAIDALDEMMDSLEPDDDLALDADDDLLLGDAPATPGAATPRAPAPAPAPDGNTRDELQAARDFADAEAALAVDDYAMAVVRLESAYAAGFDVAELHAMLAYARFMALGDPNQAGPAFELLAYAESIDPNLDLVHAYRGAILRAIGKPGQARASLERALTINPYCELAMQIMDSLGATR